MSELSMKQEEAQIALCSGLDSVVLNEYPRRHNEKTQMSAFPIIIFYNDFCHDWLAPSY